LDQDEAGSNQPASDVTWRAACFYA